MPRAASNWYWNRNLSYHISSLPSSVLPLRIIGDRFINPKEWTNVPVPMTRTVPGLCRLPDSQNGKMLPHVKYSSKRSDFADFMLTFAMSLMIFACLDLQHQGKWKIWHSKVPDSRRNGQLNIKLGWMSHTNPALLWLCRRLTMPQNNSDKLGIHPVCTATTPFGQWTQGQPTVTGKKEANIKYYQKKQLCTTTFQWISSVFFRAT